MLALRKAFGMRLTRNSMRVRRLCACRAYWARSLRARSVTGSKSLLTICRELAKSEAYLLAVDYQSELVFDLV